VVAHIVDIGTGDDEHAARDPVRRARRDPAITVDRPRLQTARDQPASAIASTGNKNSASSDRCAGAPGAQAGEFGRDRDGTILVLIPQRKGTWYDLDAVAFGPFVIGARICPHDVEILDLDMPVASPVARQYLHHAGDDEIAQGEPPERFDAGIIEHGPLVGISDQLQAFDPIVARQLKPVPSRGEAQYRLRAAGGQGLARRQAQRRQIAHRRGDHDMLDTRIGHRRLQFAGGGDLTFFDVHGSVIQPW
jgi:hypothetical protein